MGKSRSGVLVAEPNRYVFPGGVSEITDFSPEWMDLIGCKELLLRPSITRAPFYKSYSNQLSKDSLPAHIGFRICAIRETFEESGVLLVRSLRDNDEGGNSAELVSKMLSNDEIKSWRGKIHTNSSFFIELCRHIQCVPDIWSLHEWSNWITPARNIARRFNTMFYLAFLDNEPEISHDGTEVVSSTWMSPSDALDFHQSSMLNIAPPQFYEMSRLCRFSTVDDLKLFAMSLEGVEVTEPMAVESSDGDFIAFFPGDDMYEQMKCDTYKYYENVVISTPAKKLKPILPLLKVPQTTHELFVETRDTTNRLALNFKKSLFAVNCTARLKYNMPAPLVPSAMAKL